MDEYMTLKEFSELVRVPAATLQHQVRAGWIPAPVYNRYGVRLWPRSLVATYVRPPHGRGLARGVLAADYHLPVVP